MAAKTEIKLNIAVDLMEKYIKEGGGKYAEDLKKIDIKFPDFEYKGSFETDEDDLTEKKLLSNLNRAARGIYVQFSMGVDADVEDVLDKAKVNLKDKKAVRSGIDDGSAQIKKYLVKEAAAATKRLRSLMEEVIKENSAKRGGEGIDFQNEAQVTKFLKSMDDIRTLKKDYQVFQDALAEARHEDGKSQPALVARAYDIFMGCEGVHLVETARKIPKIVPVKPPDPKDTKLVEQAATVNEMAKLLDRLRPRMMDLADEVDKLKSSYPKLQDVLAGHAAGKGADQAALDKKQQALVQKAFDAFPTMSLPTITAVMIAVKDADKELADFKKKSR